MVDLVKLCAWVSFSKFQGTVLEDNPALYIALVNDITDGSPVVGLVTDLVTLNIVGVAGNDVAWAIIKIGF